MELKNPWVDVAVGEEAKSRWRCYRAARKFKPPAILSLVAVALVPVGFMAPAVALLVALEMLHVPCRVSVVRVLAAARQMALVPVMRIEVVVHMAVEVPRPVEPWSRADKHAAIEPFRPVIAVWSAVVGRVIEVPVRAHRGRPDVDADADLSGCFGGREGRHQQHCRCPCKPSEANHSSLSLNET